MTSTWCKDVQNDVKIVILTSCTRAVLHPSCTCKTTFPRPDQVHRNSGRVCKKVKTYSSWSMKPRNTMQSHHKPAGNHQTLIHVDGYMSPVWSEVTWQWSSYIGKITQSIHMNPPRSSRSLMEMQPDSRTPGSESKLPGCENNFFF